VKNACLVASVVMLAWFASAIVRLERYHYASQLGMCDQYVGEVRRGEREVCLKNAEPRTNPLWDLAYGSRLL
jgi:hypothetical protein